MFVRIIATNETNFKYRPRVDCSDQKGRKEEKYKYFKNCRKFLKKEISSENEPFRMKSLEELPDWVKELIISTEPVPDFNHKARIWYASNDALKSNFVDFDDAIQYYAAIDGGCDAIITRNIKHYKQFTIPVLTAEQFLRTL